MYRKKFLFLFIGISIFLVGYLYYVYEERKKSIELYFDRPRIGDIYKIKSDDEDGSTYVEYWKVMEVDEKGLAFAASNFKAWSSADYLLMHFDEMLPFGVEKEDLKKLKAGKWNSGNYSNASIIEIIRKQ